MELALQLAQAMRTFLFIALLAASGCVPMGVNLQPLRPASRSQAQVVPAPERAVADGATAAESQASDDDDAPAAEEVATEATEAAEATEATASTEAAEAAEAAASTQGAAEAGQAASEEAGEASVAAAASGAKGRERGVRATRRQGRVVGTRPLVQRPAVSRPAHPAATRCLDRRGRAVRCAQVRARVR